MEKIGYQLREIASNTTIQSWGGGFDPNGNFTLVDMPTRLDLPNGAMVHAPGINIDYFGYELIEWLMDRPPPTIFPISRRQFFQQAAINGTITAEEALAAVSAGVIPQILDSIITQLPDANQQFAAKMLLAGATTFERSHQLTEIIAQQLGWTSEQIDSFFLDAIKL